MGTSALFPNIVGKTHLQNQKANYNGKSIVSYTLCGLGCLHQKSNYFKNMVVQKNGFFAPPKNLGWEKPVFCTLHEKVFGGAKKPRFFASRVRKTRGAKKRLQSFCHTSFVTKLFRLKTFRFKSVLLQNYIIKNSFRHIIFGLARGGVTWIRDQMSLHFTSPVVLIFGEVLVKWGDRTWGVACDFSAVCKSIQRVWWWSLASH